MDYNFKKYPHDHFLKLSGAALFIFWIILWATTSASLFLSYFIAINLITYGFFCYVKYASKRLLLRVPEKVLFIQIILLGSCGAFWPAPPAPHDGKTALFA